jgi:hypothetical protein
MNVRTNNVAALIYSAAVDASLPLNGGEAVAALRAAVDLLEDLIDAMAYSVNRDAIAGHPSPNLRTPAAVAATVN